jgi:hypothetical protein
VRVRDVVPELRAFAANVAYLCHDFAPNFGVSCCRVQRLEDDSSVDSGITQTCPEIIQTKATSPGGLSGRVVTHRTGSLPNLQYTRNWVGRQDRCWRSGRYGRRRISAGRTGVVVSEVVRED